jgi:hypothetical protein
MDVTGYYLELSPGGNRYENPQQNSVCVSFGGPTEPKFQAPSLNNFLLTTVRPHNSPVSSQDLSSLTTLSMPLVTIVAFPCHERTNIQTCTWRKTKDETSS